MKIPRNPLSTKDQNGEGGFELTCAFSLPDNRSILAGVHGRRNVQLAAFTGSSHKRLFRIALIDTEFASGRDLSIEGGSSNTQLAA